MENINISRLTTQNVNSNSPTGQNGQTQLEVFLQTSVLEDYNTQLANLAHSMQENLNAKKGLQNDLNVLHNIDLNHPKTSATDSNIPLTVEEHDYLKDKYKNSIPFSEVDGHFEITRDQLTSLTTSTQESLALLNSNSETVSLQVQTVMEGRKLALTMLSNMIASTNEATMNIIRNIK